jgi:hypothetical protein
MLHQPHHRIAVTTLRALEKTGRGRDHDIAVAAATPKFLFLNFLDRFQAYALEIQLSGVPVTGRSVTRRWLPLKLVIAVAGLTSKFFFWRFLGQFQVHGLGSGLPGVENTRRSCREFAPGSYPAFENFLFFFDQVPNAG